MRHIKDVKNLIENGNSGEAMAVLDNVLGLAPRNPDGLRYKAQILDSWGRFDEALVIRRQMSELNTLDDESIRDLEQTSSEEKEAFIYSELTPEGRWYFAFPRIQLWISLYGFVGCALFLLLSPGWLNMGADGFQNMLVGFVTLVLIPWIALLLVHFTGIKKVLVNTDGVKICKRFSEKQIQWANIRSAVMEYDNDMRTGYLQLKLYGYDNPKEPLAQFNLSSKNSVVRARRHFVRHVLTYVNDISFLSRNPLMANQGNTLEIVDNKDQAA